MFQAARCVLFCDHVDIIFSKARLIIRPPLVLKRRIVSNTSLTLYDRHPNKLCSSMQPQRESLIRI